MSMAPVALFVYNRPLHTQRTVEALLANRLAADTPLYVFSDAAREEEAQQAVAEVRAYVRQIVGFASVTLIEREVNYGLAHSIIVGVTQLCEEFSRVIVLEDDLLTAPTFLKYMNEALVKYQDEERVMQISGYMFDVPELEAGREALFFPLTVSWGWGTWRRAWNRFDPAASGWEALRTDPALRRRFNLQGAFDYATMLFRQMEGLCDSWAIRWYWTVFKADGLVVFPPASLVRNNGFDGSGSHGRGWLRRFSGKDRAYHDGGIVFPALPQFSEAQFRCMLTALRRQNGGPMARIIDAVRRIFRS